VDYSASNPITAAAAPLLILLGRLRLMVVDMQAVPLMNHVARQITEFEKKILAAGVTGEDAQVAKYALCGTADDIVQNLPGTDRHVWMQYSMLAQFFQVRTSGIGFFEELNKVLANPAPRYNLLELMHACLSLGFEGQYRGAAGGDVELQRIRRDVYQTLRHLKARSDEDISPRWRGMAVKMRDFSSRVPIWAVASLTGAALVAIFFMLRFMISSDGDALAQTLVHLHPNTNITIERTAFKPFTAQLFDPNTSQLQRIKDGLKDDIAAGQLAVEPVGDDITIRVNNLVLFDSGKADVKPEFAPVAQHIAETLNKEPGPINVIGHTDNVKPRPGGAFKSNYDLSVARAQSVDDILAKALKDPSRVVVSGKGEDEPVASNDTAEGRAQNRRVEIMIQKEETLQPK
jgi:type VI secretion system protein ImpK